MNPHSSMFFLINTLSGCKRKSLKVLRDLNHQASIYPDLLKIEELDPINIDDQLQRAEKYKNIIIGGGDGTVSKLLNKLISIKSRIGILPLGTGNDLARELGTVKVLPYEDITGLIDFYQNATSKAVTIFALEYGDSFSDKILFVNYVSFGLDGKVIEDFANWRNNNKRSALRSVWFNRLLYLIFSIKNLNYNLIADPPIIISSNEKSFSFVNCKSIIFPNIKSVMGIGISNTESSPFDDKIECVKTNSALNYLTMLLNYCLPMFHPTYLGTSKVWNIDDRPANCSIQIDGESFNNISSHQFRIRPVGTIDFLR